MSKRPDARHEEPQERNRDVEAGNWYRNIIVDKAADYIRELKRECVRNNNMPDDPADAVRMPVSNRRSGDVP
jgi:hypothetical protein